MSRRPSMAFSMVISSVYSMSLPTGMPIAMRVTFTPAALQLLGKYTCGGLAFDCGIGGENDLVDVSGIDAGDQIRDAQLLRTDAVQRRDRSVEDVEDSVEVLGLLDGGDVGRLFDYADQPLVARRAGAVDARVDVGDVVADGAEAQIGLDVADGSRQRLGIFVARAQDVERQALRAFGAHAGELFQLIDQARHGFGKFGHGELSVIW